PEGLSAVVERMMRKSPDERYSTPLGVAEALEAYTDSPAGTLHASSGSSTIRGGVRSAGTDTQVVDAPRITTNAPAPLATQVSMQFADEAPISPVHSSPYPASRPPTVPTSATPAGGSSTPGAGSNVNWDDLGLGIDLGPEPSLTEGLQSGKKRSSS